MFCLKCGKELPDGSAFCISCGTKLMENTNDTPVNPTTKEGWMLLAVRDSIANSLKDPSSVKFNNFENIEIDSYGRTYAEIVVHAKNSYGAYVPTRYAVGFFDVTDSAPCMVIPKSLSLLAGIMVGTQRKVAKKFMKFGSPR